MSPPSLIEKYQTPAATHPWAADPMGRR
jgi:hypothetical protein